MAGRAREPVTPTSTLHPVDPTGGGAGMPPGGAAGGGAPAAAGSGSLHSVAVTTLSVQVLVAAAAFVQGVVSARVLGPGGRGVLAVVLQAGYVLVLASTLGGERAAQSDRAGGRDTVGLLAFTVWRRGLWVTGALAAIGCLVAALWAPGLGLAGVAVALVAFGSAGLRVARTAGMLDPGSRLRQHLVVTAATQAVVVASALALAAFGVRSVGAWAAAYTAAMAVPAAWWAWLLRRTPRPPVAERRRFARRSWALLAGSFASVASLRADRLLLPAMAGTRQLGYYVALSTLVEATAWPMQSYIEAWTTRASRSSERPSRGMALLAGAAALAAAAVVYVAARVLTVPLFGEAFAPARRLAPALAVGAAAHLLARYRIGVALAGGRTGTVNVAEGLGLAVALFAYVALIPPLGAVGAAWASAASYLVAAAAAGSLPLRRVRAPRNRS